MTSITRKKAPLLIKNEQGAVYMIINDPEVAMARWEHEAKSSSHLIASAARTNLALLDAAMRAEQLSRLGRIGHAALGYAARGCAIIPLEPRGKRPAGRLVPHGVKQATTDLETITSWWSQGEYNIGLACGAPSGIWVLDVDGEEGEASLAALEADYGALPPTLEQITGGGGRQLFWRVDGYTTKNSVRRLGPGLDTRGDGGYVVVPPSIHPSGARYRWATRTYPAFAPSWLVDIVKEQPKSIDEYRFKLPPGEVASDKLAALVETVKRAPVGQRNSLLFWAACRMAEQGLSIEQIWAELGDVAIGIGLDEREVRASIASATRRSHDS